MPRHGARTKVRAYAILRILANSAIVATIVTIIVATIVTIQEKLG
jgi:hypothetical protein